MGHSMKSNEMAECTFTPQQPLVVDTFMNCEGLSRVAFMDGNGVVMLGKVVTCCARKMVVAQAARRSERTSEPFHVCMAHDDACGERIRWPVQKRPKCNKACSFCTSHHNAGGQR